MQKIAHQNPTWVQIHTLYSIFRRTHNMWSSQVVKPYFCSILQLPSVGMHNVHRDLERSRRVQGEIYLNHFPRDVKNDLCTRHIRFTSGFNLCWLHTFHPLFFFSKTAWKITIATQYNRYLLYIVNFLNKHCLNVTFNRI